MEETRAGKYIKTERSNEALCKRPVKDGSGCRRDALEQNAGSENWRLLVSRLWPFCNGTKSIQESTTIFFNSEELYLSDCLRNTFYETLGIGLLAAKTDIGVLSLAYLVASLDFLSSLDMRIALSKIRPIRNLRSNRRDTSSFSALSTLRRVPWGRNH